MNYGQKLVSHRHSKVSNPSEYIQGFNWVKNWIDLYFFNKVSDFILGLIVTIFIVVIFFKKHLFKVKNKKINKFFYLIYIIIIILGVEWFYNHPCIKIWWLLHYCFTNFHTHLLKA